MTEGASTIKRRPRNEIIEGEKKRKKRKKEKKKREDNREEGREMWDLVGR